MLPNPDLEALAEGYRNDRDRRRFSRPAAQVRGRVARAHRYLRQTLEEISDFAAAERSLIGITAAEVAELLRGIKDAAATVARGVAAAERMELSGKRRFVDYAEPPARFVLAREVAARLDEKGILRPDALLEALRDVLELAGEQPRASQLKDTCAEVQSARRNGRCVCRRARPRPSR
jgi:hypothetical protein